MKFIVIINLKWKNSCLNLSLLCYQWVCCWRWGQQWTRSHCCDPSGLKSGVEAVCERSAERHGDMWLLFWRWSPCFVSAVSSGICKWSRICHWYWHLWHLLWFEGTSIYALSPGALFNLIYTLIHRDYVLLLKKKKTIENYWNNYSFVRSFIG